MKPTNLQESQMVNYAISNELHNFLLKFKAFSNNRFENYLNKYHKTVNGLSNEPLEFESVHPISDNGNMFFAVFFKGNTECTKYSFRSEIVKNWLRGFSDKMVQKIEYGELEG
jgi:hypothetical protein